MKNILSSFKTKLVDFNIKNPKLNLVIAAVIFASLLPFILKIKMNFGARVWFRQNDPNIIRLNKFERTFGNDEKIVLVLYNDKDVFNSKALKDVYELTEKFWKVTDIYRVESISNFNWTTAVDDDIVTEPFLDESQIDDPTYLQKKKAEALKHRVIPRMYMSDDSKSFILYGSVVLKDKNTDNEKIYSSFEKMVGDHKFNDESLKYHLMGGPSLSAEYQRTSFLDIGIMTPLLIILVILYLVYCFRSWKGVLIPLGIIFLSLFSTMGLIGLFGIEVNSLTFILPGVLIAISIADSVHILATYYTKLSESNDQLFAAKASLEKNLYPIFLTSLSTAIGFFSLCSSDIVPISDTGLLAGLGTTFAFIYSYLFVVPFLIITPVRDSRDNLGERVLPRNKVKGYIDWLAKHSGKTIIFFSLLTIVLTYLSLQNEINSNPYEYFKDSHKISKGNFFILDKFKGLAGPEIVIDSGSPEGAKDPTFLKNVEAYQNWIESLPYVNKVSSVIDTLKEVNQSLFGGKESEYRINDRKDVIAQELFLYTMGLPQGMDINNQMSLNNQKVRLTAMWSLQDSKTCLEAFEFIKNKASDFGLNVNVTGKAVLYQQLNDYVVMTFFKSMSTALIIITVLLIFVFGDFKTGILSLIPNFVPILYGAGLLTILKTPIDVGCAIVASVTLGIAVDDTIHFLSHFNTLRKQGYKRVDALTEVLTTTGLALVVTTIILVSCFGIFVFAHLTPNVNFGILCAYILFFALICDVVLLPAIILFVDNYKTKKSSLQDSALSS